MDSSRSRPVPVVPVGAPEVSRVVAAPSPNTKANASFGRFVLHLAVWLVMPAVVVGAFYYFFGETNVKATLDGRPVHAQVWIDGKYVHDTPYTTRLGFGEFKIEVFPPDGSDTDTSQETLMFWSIVRGTDFTADFETIVPENDQ